MILKKYTFLLITIIVFISCKRSSNTLKIKGSDTEVNLASVLAEEFHEIDNELTISVSGGGSGLGIASLLNGQADIANSSRPLDEEEIKLFKGKNIRLNTIAFAEDATAIIVNPNINIEEIDVKTLADIMSGKVVNWKTIGGPDLSINIYGRQSSSGTHSFVQKKLNIKFSRRAKEMNGNAQILEGIKIDPSGIGYVGAGYLSTNDPSVKILKIKGPDNATAISPLDENAIRTNQYFLQRPLFQFIPIESWEKAKRFIEFERSERGKQIIINSGYYVIDSL